MEQPVVERARRAVAAVFGLAGLTFASWASRTPAIRDALRLTASELGLLLVSLSVGSLAALPCLARSCTGSVPARTVLGTRPVAQLDEVTGSPAVSS